MKLENIKKAYFIGIKGQGMTALAQILQGRGIEILGSDTEEEFSTNEVLKRLRIKVFEGFNAKNIPADIDLVVASVAYLSDNMRNVEVEEIKWRGMRIWTYPQTLGLLFENKYGIAVSGTHGKSTTTSMLGFVLEQAGLDPEVVVGTRVAQWKSNARTGKSKYFVIEADEYRDAFSYYHPKGLVLTCIEYDHPDFFNNFAEYKKVFKQLVKKMPQDGFIVANNEDPAVKDVVKDARCKVVYYAPLSSKVALQLPGRHNRLNAGAVMAVAKLLGLDEKIAQDALVKFKGISRRLEIKGRYKGALLVDDFAHHPTEIRASISAIKDRYPRKNIWAVFQPHTFSRTKALLDDFAHAFKDADKVIILDIYGSARERQGTIHSKQLIDKMPNRRDAQYLPTIEKVASFLKGKVGRNDVVLAMGAGNVWEVLDLLKK